MTDVEIDLQQFEEIFCTAFKKLHGTSPTIWHMNHLHRGLRYIFSALASVDSNIGTWKVPPEDVLRHCAKYTLRYMLKISGRSWSYNKAWRIAAQYAENYMSSPDTTTSARFRELLHRARQTTVTGK